MKASGHHTSYAALPERIRETTGTDFSPTLFPVDSLTEIKEVEPIGGKEASIATGKSPPTELSIMMIPRAYMSLQRQARAALERLHQA